jgi:hypothetical protein
MASDEAIDVHVIARHTERARLTHEERGASGRAGDD